LIIVGGPKARVAMAEGILERLVQHRGSNIEKGLHGRPVPAHLLFLVCANVSLKTANAGYLAQRLALRPAV
jgi:hypothetical protein